MTIERQHGFRLVALPRRPRGHPVSVGHSRGPATPHTPMGPAVAIPQGSPVWRTVISFSRTSGARTHPRLLEA